MRHLHRSMIVCIVALLGHLSADGVPLRSTPECALAHEGKSVNGLRLEVHAKVAPPEEGSSSPRLMTTTIFHNESNELIVLDGYLLHSRLVFSRVSPADMVESRELRPVIECPLGPEPRHVIRIPPLGKHALESWQWFSSLCVRYGRCIEGRLVDHSAHQLFEIRRPGELTIAFAYRADGKYADSYLKEFLQPGEQLWTGRVYSNAVRLRITNIPDR